MFRKLDSSAGKESASNAGNPGSIPGLGSSTGEGIGYPLQYSGASLVPQTVNNLPTLQETWVQSLGWEGSPGGGHGNPFQYSFLENLQRTEEPGRTHSMCPWGQKELDTTKRTAQHWNKIFGLLSSSLLIFN